MRIPRPNLGRLGALGAPIALVGVLRLGLMLDPAESGAGTPDPLATEAGPAIARATPEEARLLAWIDSIDLTEPVASPFRVPGVLRPDEDAPPPERDEPRGAAPAALPDLEVTMITRTPKGPVARINGELKRVADPVGDGWSIAAIDAPRRAILVRHSDGRESVLRMGDPSLGDG